MKLAYLTPILILFYSCSPEKYNSNNNDDNLVKNETVVKEFQTIIDSNNLNGSILIYNLKNDQYYSNDFKWAKKGQLPASTFKITNSIIAFETNVVPNDSTLFKWNGEKGI